MTVVSSLNSLLEDEQEALQWIRQQVLALVAAAGHGAGVGTGGSCWARRRCWHWWQLLGTALVLALVAAAGHLSLIHI